MRSLRRLFSESVLGMTVREHIGGQFAIPWIAVAISLPLNIFSTIATNVTSVSDGTVLQWFIVSLAGVGAMLAVFLIAQFTIMRRARQHPVPIWVVALIGGISGVARLPVMNIALEAQGVPILASSTQTGRVMSSAILGIVLLPLGAFVTSTVYQFRRQRTGLVASEISLHQAQMRAEGATAALREVLVKEVEADLSSAIDDVNQGSPSLHDSLQRTGRELWSPPTPDDPARFKWGQVLEAGIRRNPLPTLLVLLIWIPAAVMSFASFLDWPETVLRVATAAIAIALVFQLGRRWIALRGSSTTGVLIMTLIVSWVVTSPVSWWLWSDRSLDLAIPTMFSNAVWLTLITVLSGMGIAALRSSDAIVRDLRGKVSEAEIQALAANEELAIARRELAALLHGPVRSRLSTASALLNGVDGVSGHDVSVELEAALLALKQVKTDTPATHELLAEVTGVLDPWNPLLEIEVSCPELSSDLAASAAILVEEAVANAYRHGQARHVRVLITGHSSSIHVVVEDDGTGIDPNAHSGLGTELFEQYTPGTWLRESIPSGGTRIQWTLSRDDSSD
jgi:hypothetical protein